MCVLRLTVHGHFINLCGVVLLDISQDTDVIILHKVNGHTLPAVTPRSTNPDELSEKIKSHSNEQVCERGCVFVPVNV